MGSHQQQPQQPQQLLQTPRRLPASRPSLAHSSINTASTPSLSLAARTDLARKASLSALTANGSQQLPQPTSPVPPMPDGAGAPAVEVGDTVDVPGSMYGVVKFVGNVKGKKGTFAGVELAREFAARGKNDGDVDGTRYFTTSVPGAGIFLPVHRASKRMTPTVNADTFPPTPTTPSFSASAYGLNGTSHGSPETPAVPPKFSQSVGPGARAPSPVLKPKPRGSLPRPESPFPQFSKSLMGPPRYTGASSTTSSPGPTRSAIAKPPPRTPSARPYSRSGSRLGDYESIAEDPDTTPVGASRTSGSSSTSGFGMRGRPGSGPAEEEIQRLQKRLEERDRQLREQAASLTEMENSLAELQTLIPSDTTHQRGMSLSGDDMTNDAAQLRALLREKNEKIAALTAEFDAHRADFRSTIDTLEMASTETVRVYERRTEDLLAEIKELQDRGDDVESVARQLKQLEELVQELEEGLEDARRGEAEARGEVEFLRGEVERGRSELRREREKAAAALKKAGQAIDGGGSGGSSFREVEQRDDEIRGLKAIIHSLSSGPDLAVSPGLGERGASPGLGASAAMAEELERVKATMDRLEREKDELRGLVERKAFREEELEREIDLLRRGGGGSGTSPSTTMAPPRRAGAVTPNSNNNIGAPQHAGDHPRDSVISNALSDRTATQADTGAANASSKRSSGRDSRGTVISWRGGQSPKAARGHHAHHHHHVAPTPLEPMIELDAQSATTSTTTTTGGSGALWCEMCETAGHDILSCANLMGGGGGGGGGGAQPDAAAKTSNDALVNGSPARAGAGPHQLRRKESSIADAAAAAKSPSADAHPAPLFQPRRVGSSGPAGPAPSASPPSAVAAPAPAPASAMPSPYEGGLVPAKGEQVADPNKWCALCERDGHDATMCPFEDAF
ncbi:hypothetical protein BDY21DRAFT_377401 [Lineolata rhizophorae]|uniref:CAP-Gly domain-containing protein n=1 Tax=Lineolata rhizophorae TaxID=578093 RepID=A0A6A6P8M3_9PEZI|nr:hypothetical protein BDY21DRAFT_377401 [Lineolata rhizophorae]